MIEDVWRQELRVTRGGMPARSDLAFTEINRLMNAHRKAEECASKFAETTERWTIPAKRPERLDVDRPALIIRFVGTEGYELLEGLPRLVMVRQPVVPAGRRQRKKFAGHDGDDYFGSTAPFADCHA